MDNSEMQPPIKRFLANLALFFLPLFAGAYFLDAFLSANLRKSHDGELGAWNEIFAGNVSSDIVIYGTSRAVGQFDPQIMSAGLGMTAYNLGMQGNDFEMQYLRHAVLLKYNARPKVIVQSVEPSTFLKRKNPYEPDQFLPYLLSDPQVMAGTDSYRIFNFWDRHVPMVRYYGKATVVGTALKVLLHPSGNVPERARGYKTLSISWDGKVDQAKRTWLRESFMLDPVAIQLFDRYLQECRELGIKVIFVSPPQYVDARLLVPFGAEVSAIVEAMRSKYGIPFLDYSESWLTAQPEYFSDVLHLNTRGATLFTRELTVALKPLV
jgi:hypothetical protein